MDLVVVKIERAEKHLRDLYQSVDSFFGSGPYKVGTHRDTKTGELIYYLAEAAPIPAAIGAIAGDAIQNCRTALDHLVQQLWLVNNPNGGTSSRDVSFPTDTSAQQFESRLQGKVGGLRQDAIDLIKALEPYDGGKGERLAVLNRVNRVDKHRALLTTYANINIDFVPDLKRIAPSLFLQLGALTSLGMFAKRETVGRLKVGDVLYVAPSEAPDDDDRKIMLGISLSESGIPEGESIIETVQGFADLVRVTVGLFKECLE